MLMFKKTAYTVLHLSSPQKDSKTETLSQNINFTIFGSHLGRHFVFLKMLKGDKVSSTGLVK